MRFIQIFAVGIFLASPSLATEAVNISLTQGAGDEKAITAPQILTRLPQPPLSEQVQASYGCFSAGLGGTVAAWTVGAENLVNVVAGGIVAPANPAVLTIGVLGVVFASFCTVGQALTPMALDVAARLEEPAEWAVSASISFAGRMKSFFFRAPDIAVQEEVAPLNLAIVK